jgi:CRISPR-associated protein Csm3
MRSLLEWRAGIVGESKGKPVSISLLETLTGDKKQHAEVLIRLFGAAGDTKNDAKAEEIGITRLSFWDCSLNNEWKKQISDNNWLYTEAKSENTINRITGTADNPRQTERVPADTIFDFQLGMKILSDLEDGFVETVLAGLKLLELDGIGGSGSRGYGKIKFENLKLNNVDLQARLDTIDPFKAA